MVRAPAVDPALVASVVLAPVAVPEVLPEDAPVADRVDRVDNGGLRGGAVVVAAATRTNSSRST